MSLALFEWVESRVLFAISFQPPVNSGLESLTVVAAGDFNHDGLADIVAKGHDGLVNFFAGTGDGHFTPTNAATPVYAGANVVSIAIADFNRDGNLDFVAANSANSANTGNVAVLPGNGNGTFQPAKFYSAGPDPAGVAVADINGDGKLDLIVSDQGTWVTTSGGAYGAARLLATNSGFGAPTRIPLNFPSTAVAMLGGSPAASSIYSVVKVAFAGPNVMSAAPMPSTMLAIMMPMTNSPLFQTSILGTNRGIAATDLNRDRWLDVAALQVLGNNFGANTSTNVYTISTRIATSTLPDLYGVKGPFATGLDSGFGIVAGDLDGDRVGDVAVAGTRSLGPMLPAFVGSVAALAGTGNGALGVAKTFDVGAIPSAIAAGRVNRDAAVDVLTTNSAGVSSLLNARPAITIFSAVSLDELSFTEKLVIEVM